MSLASKLHYAWDVGREVHIKFKEREKEPSVSIQKKSLISALKTTKKANIAKEELSSPGVATQDAKDLQTARRLQGTARHALQAGKSHLQGNKGSLQGNKGSLQGNK